MIRLTDTNGQSVLINPCHIVTVNEPKRAGLPTTIRLDWSGGAITVNVRETLYAIEELCAGAKDPYQSPTDLRDDLARAVRVLKQR